jgi:hypothetical protein
MERYNNIMQYVWLAVAILSAAFALYTFFTLPIDEEPEYMIFLLPLVAGFLFYLRRRHNAVMNKNN